jgi:hypothetical protein
VVLIRKAKMRAGGFLVPLSRSSSSFCGTSVAVGSLCQRINAASKKTVLSVPGDVQVLRDI